MTSKSKTKGNRWELELSKFLTKEYDQPFIRVVTSGSFIGGKNVYRKAQLQEAQIMSKKGDIHPPDNWTYFNCEAKSYADFRFHQLFTGNNALLDGWIEQVYEVAEEKDFNIIFMKFNNKGKWVAYEKKHKRIIVERGLEYHDWIFCSWDDFWKHPNNKKYMERKCTKG